MVRVVGLQILDYGERLHCVMSPALAHSTRSNEINRIDSRHLIMLYRGVVVVHRPAKHKQSVFRIEGLYQNLFDDAHRVCFGIWHCMVHIGSSWT